MKKFLLQVLFLFFAVAAYSEEYDIVEVTTYVDADDEDGTKEKVNGTANYGNIGLTITFGNFTVYNFITNKVTKTEDMTTVNATDLVNGFTTDICMMETKEGIHVLIETPSGRNMVFVLVKKK